MRVSVRFAAAVGVAALGTVVATPALAAAPVAQSGANALTVSIAGEENGTGNVTATHDGSGEQRTGDTAPPVSVLKGQELFRGGALAQEASASVVDGLGRSRACAGLTGNGGAEVQIGSSRCLRPGRSLGLTLGNLDLSDTLVIDPESALGPLAETNPALQTVLGGVTGPLADTVAQTPLGDTGLTGTLDAVAGSCTAGPGTASGDAFLSNARITLTVADQQVVLADLPTHPAPNTHVPVNLDGATQAIVDAVRTQLEGSFEGALAPLAELPAQLQDQVVEALVEATREQLLQPLGDNVLDLVLNKQTRTGKDQIRVSAVDLSVLPAAREQLDAPLAGVQIGNVVCGPNGGVAVAAPAAAPSSSLPTGVSGGLESAPVSPAPRTPGNTVTLAAFALLVGAGTALSVLRRLRA